MAKKITPDGEIVDLVTHEVIGRAPPFFKTPWNHDTEAESLACGLTCLDESKAQQQFAKDADINEILRKFMAGGDLPLTGQPRYMDVDREYDLQNEIVTGYEVQQAWDALPAAVRNILKDPKVFTEYVEHCLERGDLDPLIELGLAVDKTPKATPEPPKPPSPPGGAPDPSGGKAAPAA